MPQLDASLEGVTVQRMRWWHIAELDALERELFPGEHWTPEMFFSELAQYDTRYYRVASKGGEIVGYAGLCVYGSAGDAQAWVQTIGVRRDMQGRGLGSALLTDLIAEARRWAATTLSLEVRADNATAQRMYARYGFEPVGVRRGYYQPSNVDALTMTLEL